LLPLLQVAAEVEHARLDLATVQVRVDPVDVPMELPVPGVRVVLVEEEEHPQR